MDGNHNPNSIDISDVLVFNRALNTDEINFITATLSEPKKMTHLGVGYCTSGYYAGWDGQGIDSQESCNQVCLTEQQCTYAAFFAGQTCSRYNGNSCTLNSDKNHITYAKRSDRPKIPENECGTQQLERCDGFPCVDLLEGTGHHHMMSYVSKGVATVAYYDSKFVPDLRKWTCTCSTAGENSLVGVWSCPGFYSGTVTITADYADDFTQMSSNDAVLFCKDCWQTASVGVDLAWGEWDGTGYTSFKQCNARHADLSKRATLSKMASRPR